MSQQSLADIKWRKRMCYKWQEEMTKQLAETEELVPRPMHESPQRSQHSIFAVSSASLRPTPVPVPVSVPVPLPLAVPAPARPKAALAKQPKTKMETFLEDPLSLKKLFLPQCVVHHLVARRSDYRRVMKSCFVRVNVGRCFGPPRYRVAQIDGYAGRTRAGCDAQLQLLLRIDQEKPQAYAIQRLANAYFEPIELLEWQCLWLKYNLPLPSKKLIEQKYRVIIVAKEQLLHQNLSQTMQYRKRTSVTGSITNTTTSTVTETTTTTAMSAVSESVLQSQSAKTYVSPASASPMWQLRMAALQPPTPPRLVNKCGSITHASFIMHTPASLLMPPPASNKPMPKSKSKSLIPPLPKLIPLSPKPVERPMPPPTPAPFPPPTPQPEPMPLKKRISLAEYRKRRTTQLTI